MLKAIEPKCLAIGLDLTAINRDPPMGRYASAMPDTPYDRIGGEQVAAIVQRFYDLMDQDQRYQGLRAMHAEDLDPMRASLTGFLTAWLGGPRDWFTQRPGTCVMSLHRAMPITPDLAGQWIDAMDRAIGAQPAIPPDLAAQMAQALSRMASAMASQPLSA